MKTAPCSRLQHIWSIMFGLTFQMFLNAFRLSRFQLVLLASSPNQRQSSIRPILLFQLLLVVLTVPQDVFPSLSCECNPEKCPKANCTQADLDPCTCCLVCVKSEGERCGGLSNVEGSCGNSLKCVQRPGSIFGWERAGVCESTLCGFFQPSCGFRQRCSFIAGSFQCNCPQFQCAGKFNPVCGYDNLEYTSVCRLQEEECKTGKFIGIKSFGACGREDGEAGDPIDLNDIVSVPTNGGCVYMNNWYTIGQKVEPTQGDPCQVIYCTAPDTLKVVSYPGCGDNPPEEDYGVDKPPIHGGWSPWSPWSQCAGSCGSALRRRERNCTNPAPANEGRVCSGVSVEEAECIPKTCEESSFCANYVYGWSYWSPCNANCGQGRRERVRHYRSPVFKLSSSDRRVVFDTCPATQEESCSITDCQNEACSGTLVLDYIWRKHPDLQYNIAIDRVEQNCRSIQKYSFLVCGGMCSLQPSRNSSVSMETACCQPNNSQTTSVTFQCHPDVLRQREIRVDFPDSCSCVPCDT